MIKNVFLVAILLCALTSLASAQSFTGKVLAVGGADNISVAGDNNAVTVRLNCVAAPVEGQPYAPEAVQFLQNLLMGKSVYVQVVWQDSDQRQVSRVSIDGQDVGTALVSAGLAWYDDRHGKDGQVQIAQAEAQGKKIAIWSQPSPMAPWDFARLQRNIIPNTSGPPVNVSGQGYQAPAASTLSDAGSSWDNNNQPLSTSPYYGDAYYYPGARGIYPGRNVTNAHSARGATSRGGGRR